MNKIELDISWEIDIDPEIENKIKETVKMALEVENAVCDVNLSVVVTDNENICEINKEQRGIDKPTDVLSFPGFSKTEWEELKGTKDELVSYSFDCSIIFS